MKKNLLILMHELIHQLCLGDFYSIFNFKKVTSTGKLLLSAANYPKQNWKKVVNSHEILNSGRWNSLIALSGRLNKILFNLSSPALFLPLQRLLFMAFLKISNITSRFFRLSTYTGNSLAIVPTKGISELHYWRN
jgi:hypothetical protein